MPVKVASASLRDRTLEFQSIAERLKKSFSSVQNGPISSSTSSGSRSEEQRTTIAMQSEFNRRASKIGFGIHQTSQKLAKLAKRKPILGHLLVSQILHFVLRIHSISYLFVRLYQARLKEEG